MDYDYVVEEISFINLRSGNEMGVSLLRIRLGMWLKQKEVNTGSSSREVENEAEECCLSCGLKQESGSILDHCSHSFCSSCLKEHVSGGIIQGHRSIKCPECGETLRSCEVRSVLEGECRLLGLYERQKKRPFSIPRFLLSPHASSKSKALVPPPPKDVPESEEKEEFKDEDPDLCCLYGRVSLKCPKCPESMHPNDVETCVDGNTKLLSLYESLTLRKVLSCDPDVRWCPAPDCVYAVIAAGCASCPKDFMRMVPCIVLLPLQSRMASESNICSVLIVKMDDGSCNHMTCSVCEAEFCWLCMKEISSLHYLSPSGCTFWGKKPWSRKKKLLCQLGTLVGAPLGIALLASISIPAMVIGIPIWTGTKLHQHYRRANKHKRNCIISTGVIASIIISPFMAAVAVGIGVPVLFVYVYGVVPIILCSSEECGLSNSENAVKIDIDEEVHYKPVNVLCNQNPSIGEVSLGASLGSASHLERENRGEVDRESASNTAVAGTSICGSIASSYLCQQRLEVGADVHSRKKFSYSTERLSGGDSSIDNNSTRAVLSCKFGDSQSMISNGDNLSMAHTNGTTDDQISLHSLPTQNSSNHHSNRLNNVIQNANHPSKTPRSVSPVSFASGDELIQGAMRRSARYRKLHLDKQISENSSLLSMEDYGSERVRFDDNVSFIDDAQNNNNNFRVSNEARVDENEENKPVKHQDPKEVSDDKMKTVAAGGGRRIVT
ncbi:RNF19A [Lepeophtheirus salmonis]|uniref:RNF19A n=1 Tax=Lepeophtheirus salmonis TaxID=72036 RepID=A0A7R8CZ33_LEPSM|nr:RNF19A [Lepeophtheirus salmonis]CAF2946470.1 RNF19A [Lepeophtheirus salmonis]